MSGQSSVGYERAVLNQAALPDNVVDGIESMEVRREDLHRAISGLKTGLFKFSRISGVGMEERVVLGENQFENGIVLVRKGRDPLTVNQFVADVFNLIDGEIDLQSLVDKLSNHYEINDKFPDQVKQVVRLLIFDEWIKISTNL